MVTMARMWAMSVGDAELGMWNWLGPHTLSSILVQHTILILRSRFYDGHIRIISQLVNTIQNS
jgi:hypothetical protein